MRIFFFRRKRTKKPSMEEAEATPPSRMTTCDGAWRSSPLSVTTPGPTPKSRGASWSEWRRNSSPPGARTRSTSSAPTPCGESATSSTRSSAPWSTPNPRRTPPPQRLSEQIPSRPSATWKTTTTTWKTTTYPFSPRRRQRSSEDTKHTASATPPSRRSPPPRETTTPSSRPCPTTAGRRRPARAGRRSARRAPPTTRPTTRPSPPRNGTADETTATTSRPGSSASPPPIPRKTSTTSAFAASSSRPKWHAPSAPPSTTFADR
mmetsp:Transcript_32816/g.104661  ORF Transcript_32816/g.104661 Transcript_32816/m.104661 type:complete len:263 (+) Transcript_32816:984-1772(+)